MFKIINTDIEKSFYCVGSSQPDCFGCAYCRARDTCKSQISHSLLPTQINKDFKDIPVAVNLYYGDPLLQIDSTLKYLRRLEKEKHEGIVTIITKGDFSIFPDEFFDLNLHTAFSTFGVNHKYDGGTWERFINNLKCISKRKNNYTYSIELRPICYELNDTSEILEGVIKAAAEYNLPLSYSGLQGKPEMVKEWKEQGITLKPYPNYSFGHVKPISAEVESNLRSLASTYNVTLFHKTSCMLSYVYNLPYDYNCHYYRPDEVRCDLCPMETKCSKAKEEIREIALPFEYKLEYKQKHECVLAKNGKCNYPTESCKNISGYVLTTPEHLTIADYRMIKWLTGYTVDSDFSYDTRLSDMWWQAREK